MKTRTAYTLIAILATIGTLSASQAYAQSISYDLNEIGQSSTPTGIPIIVMTDSDTYNHESTIMVTGQVANVKPEGVPVTLTVTSPLNNIVTIQQIDVNSDGSFATTLNTAGGLWKYDGIYVIRVQYGAQEVNNRVLVELSEGVDIVPRQPIPKQPTKECRTSELDIHEYCVPYTISGGTITSVVTDTDTDAKSLIINIRSTDSGILTLNPSDRVISDVYFVIIDGEENNDYMIDGQKITVMFPAGTEKIEIFAAHVIPEFGAIAVLILVIAIVSIIAISARSRLSIAMPRV
jgi:predicted secreted protein with PEFG-CTERM motif